MKFLMCEGIAPHTNSQKYITEYFTNFSMQDTVNVERFTGLNLCVFYGFHLSLFTIRM